MSDDIDIDEGEGIRGISMADVLDNADVDGGPDIWE